MAPLTAVALAVAEDSLVSAKKKMGLDRSKRTKSNKGGGRRYEMISWLRYVAGGMNVRM